MTFDKASVGTLWLEYRAGSGFDAKLAGTANAGGLLAYRWGHILVDLAPAAGGTAGTAADYRRAALPAGQSWTDPATGLELRTLRTESARGGSSGALVFSLEFGAGEACARSAPEIHEGMFGECMQGCEGRGGKGEKGSLVHTADVARNDDDENQVTSGFSSRRAT